MWYVAINKETWLYQYDKHSQQYYTINMAHMDIHIDMYTAFPYMTQVEFSQEWESILLLWNCCALSDTQQS